MQAARRRALACVRISARRGVRDALRVQAAQDVLGHALVFVGIAVRVIARGTVMDVADVLLRAKITVRVRAKQLALPLVKTLVPDVAIRVQKIVALLASINARLATAAKAVLVRKIQ